MTDTNSSDVTEVKQEQATEVTETEQTGQTETAEETKASKEEEVDRNKTIALKQEREARKTLEDELAQYKAKEQEAIQKEKIKKGKYEEVIAEKDEEIKALTEKAKLHDEMVAKYNSEMDSKISELKKGLAEETLNQNEDILADLSPEKQIKFLNNLVESSKKADFTAKTDANQTKAKQSDANFASKTDSKSMITAVFNNQFGINK